jgi:5-methyltetrahydrofolate--homocysteine methyltransferase
MPESDLSGALSCAEGVIRFGPGQPLLCVNDQCGYYCERPEVQAELREGRFDSLVALAARGLALGLRVFNVQFMAPDLASLERELVLKAIDVLGEKVGCGIAVDSRDPVTVDLALAAYPYKAMCNTVTGEWNNLSTMLPVIAKHGAALGSALVYEKGVPHTVKERLDVATRIVQAALEHGIPRADIIIDAVCLPASVTPGGLTVTLDTIRAIREELGVPVLLGISNAGFMMPNPRLIDLAYFIASAACGLNVAMIDPVTPYLQWLSPAMDFLLEADPGARGYLGVYRAAKSKAQTEATVSSDFGAGSRQAGASRPGGVIANV